MRELSRFFSFPEQLAIREVLHLVQHRKVEIVNFFFFSRIESSPLEITMEPQERCPQFDGEHYGGRRWPYLQTTISFYCRGTKVAEVIVEGVAAFFPAVGRLLHTWRVANVRARKYYWRDGPKESQVWREHTPANPLYSSCEFGTDEEEEEFARTVAEAIRHHPVP